MSEDAASKFRKDVRTLSQRIPHAESADLSAHLREETILLTGFGLIATVSLAFVFFLMPGRGYFETNQQLFTGTIALTIFFWFLEFALVLGAVGYRLPMRALHPETSEGDVWAGLIRWRTSALAFMRLWNGQPRDMLAALVRVDRRSAFRNAQAYAEALVDKNFAKVAVESVLDTKVSQRKSYAFVWLPVLWVLFFIFVHWVVTAQPTQRTLVEAGGLALALLSVTLYVFIWVTLHDHAEKVILWARLLRHLEGFTTQTGKPLIAGSEYA